MPTSTEPKPISRSPRSRTWFPACLARLTFCQQVRNRTAEWGRGGPTFSVVLIEVDQHQQAGRAWRSASASSALPWRPTGSSPLPSAKWIPWATTRPGCFALLLPTAGLADAIRVAERLRQEFSQCSPSAQGEQPRPTLSVGVVQVTEKDDSISLLQRAEAALDAANRRGGNRR